MILIPWEYIKEQISLPKSAPEEIGERLTYYGLETEIVSHGNNLYFKFDILPNRPDLLSWWGIIQEIGVLLNCQIKNFDFPLINENQQKPLEVVIKTNDCFGFYLGLIKNVKVKESSLQIKEWLKANNIHAVNNLVDIANLVMLESGQPFHVFDYDSLVNKKEIVIRSASEGEIINTLQGQGLVLSSKDIVISSADKLIDLAAIIGSQNTSITSQTKNVLIECASFNPQMIKETASRLNISTAASRYFSREVSLIFSPKQILARVIALIINSYQGDLNSGEFSVYKKEKKKENTIIAISQDFIEKKIGQIIPESIIENIWKQLNFSCQIKENIYYLTIPSYRADVVSAEDLLEELLRIYDYNKIKGLLPLEIKSVFFDSNKFGGEKKKISTYLANCGWKEIITYSLISSLMKEEFKKGENNEFYQLLTPKVDYHQYYRQTLIPSHLKAIGYNLSHGNKNLCFFEISSVYNSIYNEELLIISGIGKLFNQPFHKLTQELDYYWMKGVLENILGWWQLESEISFSPTSFDCLNYSQSSEIFIEKERIGFLGQINSRVSKKYQINEPVLIAEISLTKIFNYLDKYPRKISYKPISNFPVSEKDLSFVFPENIDYNLILKEIKEIVGDNLQELVIFDIYQNPEMVKEEKKSVSFHLVFQSSTKTLENKEIEKIIKNVSEKIEKLFSAKLRE